MAYGKVVFGWPPYGGSEPEGPVIASANPVSGSRISVNRRALRLKVAGMPIGTGIDNSTFALRLDGELIYGVGADPMNPLDVVWASGYEDSYFFPEADGSYTVMLKRDTNWLPAKTYTLLIDVEDNNFSKA